MKNDEVSLLDKHFNLLYTSLPYTRVHCFEDCMIYSKIPFGYNKSMVDEINAKIKELNLPLIAKTNEFKGLFSDSILVEPIDKKDYE